MIKITSNRIEIDRDGYLEEYELSNELVHSFSRFFDSAVSLNKNIYYLLENLNTPIGDGVATFYLCFLHNGITKSCRAKWRMLHLQNGESCRGYGGKYSGS